MGRAGHLSDWRDIVRPRRLAGLAERGRTLLGEAGLGKSSLVRRIATEAREAGGWATPQLRIPSGTDPLKRVASALLDLADQAGLPHARERRIKDQLDRVEAIAAGPVSVSLRENTGPEPYTALTDLLVEIGRVAAGHPDAMVLVHIDEVQNITDQNVLSQLLVALGDALVHEEPAVAPGGVEFERALPIAVYLTGLPDFAAMTSARTGATFARRFQTSTLAGLDDEDVAMALQPFVADGWETVGEDGATELVTMEPGARDAIVDLARGEPFLFQLAGERAWYAGTGNVITAGEVFAGWETAREEARSHVERILARLPKREREFLEAMADMEPDERTLTRIADRLGYAKASDAGPTAQRLDSLRGMISRGRPYSFRHRAVEAYLTSDWPDVSGGRG